MRRRNQVWARWTVLLSGVLLIAAVCSAQDSRGTAMDRVPTDDTADVHTVALPVLSPAEMSASDAELLNAREAEVSRAAAFYGFDISDTSWTYQQVVCRSLPDHLILSFSNEGGTRGSSHFVAVVPHGTDKVEVVANFAHGLLPFRPAAEREGSYGVFNRMVQADRGERAVSPNAHWLNLAMCYAALTGMPPQVAALQDEVAASEALAKRRGSTPIIRVGNHGAAEVAFSDVRLTDRTGNWTLSFDRNGQLKHVDRTEARPLKVQRSLIAGLPAPVSPE